MNILNVHQLAFSYSPSKTVLKKISFSLRAGEVFTILGPNGIGKSTLLHCLLGILPVNQGRIEVAGKDIQTVNQRFLAQQVAYVPQDYHVNSSIAVIDYLLTGRTPYLSLFQTPQHKDIMLAEKYLKEFKLIALRDRSFSSLSGGQQQLIAIIRALLQQPQLLILDEPMAALDLSRQYELLQLIKKLSRQQIAVILTTHLPDHALMLQAKVGLLNLNGTLKVGNSAQLLTKEKLEDLYQVPLDLEYMPNLHRYTCQIKL